jgi:ArsR family transcriptional regulator, arsenate/arsenite/antimonite-responsive transcriptional repressor
MKTEYEMNLEDRAQFFKALGHPIRLLMINLIKVKPRHGEELAEILKLNPATISHHLNALSRVGLLRQQKDQYYQVFSLVRGPLDKTLAEMVHLPQPDLSHGIEEDAYRDKVLKSFFHHGRLKQFPSQLKKRQIILEKIAGEFEPEKEYSEREVNQILVDFNEDVASLRRGMIELGLMTRSKGVYRRIQPG